MDRTKERLLKEQYAAAQRWLAARQIDVTERFGGLVIIAMNKYYPGGWEGFTRGFLSVA